MPKLAKMRRCPPFLSAKMDLHRYRYPALLGWSSHLDGDLEGDTHEIAVELMELFI